MPEGAAAFDSGSELPWRSRLKGTACWSSGSDLSAPAEHPHRACRHPSRTTTVIARSEIPEVNRALASRRRESIDHSAVHSKGGPPIASGTSSKRLAAPAKHSPRISSTRNSSGRAPNPVSSPIVSRWAITLGATRSTVRPYSSATRLTERAMISARVRSLRGQGGCKIGNSVSA
jgi:hypothetical protein